jgi:hypothetical protein
VGYDGLVVDAKKLLDLLKTRVGLEKRHEETLHALGDTMIPLSQEVALAFYDYLGRDEEMHALIWAVPGRVERLYGAFATWYREMFSGLYDEAYALRRMRIGWVHARLGVGPRHIIPAMGVVQELSLEHLAEVMPNHGLLKAVASLQKIIAIEISLIEESYLAALDEGLQLGHVVDSQTALTEGASVLLRN